MRKQLKNIDISTDDDITTVTFYGIGAHGSTPELGRNAGMLALQTIYDITGHQVLKQILDRYSDVYGAGIGASATSNQMGKNSLNVGIINYKEGKFSMVVNFRHVETVTQKAMIKKITTNNEGFKVKILGTSDLLYFDKRSPLVKTLLNAYRVETKDKKSQPLSTGGGTYAKEANNVVAFGMEFEGEDTKMHGVNENVCKVSLFKAMAIYARAIYDLGQLIENENKI